MNTNKYRLLVVDLVSKGVDFTQDTFNKNSGVNWGVDWNQLATDFGYRKPKNGYFSKGGHFYMLLQRVYNQLKDDGNFLNSVAERSRIKTVFNIK